MWHNKKFKFGITNQGDAGLNFTWVQRMNAMVGAVIMSKAANDELIDNLLKFKDKVIYHATCTGLGGTAFEPDVPSVTDKFNHIKRLIRLGFPKKQIVVRIDPIFPKAWLDTIDNVLKVDYMLKLENILKMTQDLGIKRVRYSYFDPFDFVLARLQKIAPEFKFDSDYSFNYDDEIQLESINPNLEYEACCETGIPESHQIGCISDKDLKILGLSLHYKCDYDTQKDKDDLCKCPVNKYELISNNSFECGHNCQYCYWRQEEPDFHSDVRIYGSYK